MFFDPLYLVMLLPAFALSIWASMTVRSRFARYAQVPNSRRISGAETARFVLDRSGLSDVPVTMANGLLSDHYDPRQRVVRLSPDVFGGRSVAAMAVAAHETGHALQHRDAYAPLALRNLAIPVASIGSNASFFLLFIGLMLHFSTMVWLGVAAFTAVVLFQLLTLPVELDASARAKRFLEESQLASPAERHGVAQVLTAAALTYVAAALTGVVTLAYFVLRARRAT